MIRTLQRSLSIAWLGAWFSAAFAVWIISDQGHYHLSETLKGISYLHWMGFDAFGRDLLQTTLRASLISSAFAALAVAVSVMTAVILGSAAALAGTALRTLFLRTLDLILAFPSMLIALSWAAVRGPSWSTLIVALLVETVPQLCRLAFLRSEELAIEPYVEAARAMGANRISLLNRHFFPAILSLALIKAPKLFAYALIAEAMLSFIGVGAPIGGDTWGALLGQGKDYLIEAPHIAIGTGVPLILTILALQLLFENESRL